MLRRFDEPANRKLDTLIHHPSLGGQLALWLALLIASAGAAGCSHNTESTLERVRREGVVRVGYANEAPYAYLDDKTQRLTGEAPEIARIILKQMGIPRVEGVLTEFGSLLPGLRAKRFDIIAAGMYITPARCEQIDFSEPTYCIGEAFIVKRGNPLNLHSYEDVAKNSAARVGVVAGAVELGYARAIGIPEDRISIFPDAASAVEGVQADRIDAYGGTSTTVQNFLRVAGADAGIEPAEPFTDPVIDGKSVRGCGAFGFRKQDQLFREEFNQHLKAFVGSPEHLRLIEPFGFTKDDLPMGETTKLLCRP